MSLKIEQLFPQLTTKGSETSLVRTYVILIDYYFCVYVGAVPVGRYRCRTSSSGKFSKSFCEILSDVGDTIVVGIVFKNIYKIKNTIHTHFFYGTYFI